MWVNPYEVDELAQQDRERVARQVEQYRAPRDRVGQAPGFGALLLALLASGIVLVFLLGL